MGSRGLPEGLAQTNAQISGRVTDSTGAVVPGVDVTLTNWRGVVAPGTVDDAQADELTQLVTDMHETEDWSAVLEENAWADAFVTGEEFGSFMDQEIVRVQQVLRDIGLVQ